MQSILTFHDRVGPCRLLFETETSRVPKGNAHLISRPPRPVLLADRGWVVSRLRGPCASEEIWFPSTPRDLNQSQHDDLCSFSLAGLGGRGVACSPVLTNDIWRDRIGRQQVFWDFKNKDALGKIKVSFPVLGWTPGAAGAVLQAWDGPLKDKDAHWRRQRKKGERT